MNTESPVPRQVQEGLAGRQPEVVERIDGLLQEGSRPELILRGMQNQAARLGDPGDLRGLLALDAVWDLLPIYGEKAGPLLGAAARYLLRFPPRTLHPEWLERAPLATSPVVYAGSLDEVLEAGDLEAAGTQVARMLAVVQTPEAFHELLLEAASRDGRPPGWNLIAASAVVRALTVRGWGEGREILFRLVESLHGSRLAPAGGPPRGEVGPLPIAAAFLVAARSARDLMGACLYLAHAFQAERYCRLRRRQLRHALGQAIETWFPGLAELPKDWRPASLRTDGETSGVLEPPAPDVDPAAGEELSARIGLGVAEGAADTALRLLGDRADPDPLFRWISAAALPSLEAGDPRPLLLVNGARWGVHLLQGNRDVLIRRLVRDLATLVGRNEGA